MGTTTRQKLEQDLKQGRLAPLYLLHGPEEFLRESAARRISDAALADAPVREFNEAAYSLAADDVQRAIAAAEQLPMMGGRRVVRVADFAKLGEADEGALVRYLARPAATSVVVFVAGDLDKRRKLSKALIESCVAVEFPAMSDGEATAWARDYLKRLKADADERTLGQIVGLTGTGARRMSVELEKLATAALPSGRITPESVEALVGRSRELSNFELTDHLVARDRRRALQTVSRLLDDGVEPLMLVGLIASNFHRLALVKEMMAQGQPEKEVFRVVNMPFNKQKDFLATARRADSAELARRISRIAAADLAIKTSLGGGGRGTRLQLEMLVCELSA